MPAFVSCPRCELTWQQWQLFECVQCKRDLCLECLRSAPDRAEEGRHYLLRPDSGYAAAM